MCIISKVHPARTLSQILSLARPLFQLACLREAMRHPNPLSRKRPAITPSIVTHGIHDSSVRTRATHPWTHRSARATLSPAVSECRSVEQCQGSVRPVSGQCRGSVWAVSGQCRLTLVSGCRAVSGQCRSSVSQCRGFLTVDLLDWRQAVSECRSVGVSECRSVGRCRSVGVSECRDPTSCSP